MRVLIPDAKFTDAADVEKQAVESQAAGSDYAFIPHHGISQADIAPGEWPSCEAVIAYDEARLDARWLERLERCRVIVRAGVGFDNVDLEAAGALGIAVCNVPDYGTTDVADHAIAMLLTLTRGTAAYDALLRDDPAANWHFAKASLIRRLRGRTFGVVGLGRIGLATALRARGLGMEVIFFDPYKPTGTEIALGFRRADRLTGLMAEADVVSLHTPLTPETAGLLNADAFADSRTGQILVNTARGPVLVLDALHSALLDGRLDGAALDVIPEEPLTRMAAHPLFRAWRAQEPWIAGRLLLSPHAAFYAPESIRDLRRKSAETVAAALGERRLVNCVNRAWLSPRRGWSITA